MSQKKTTASLGEKPGEVTTIAIMTLVSGIANILASLVWIFLVMLGTLGFGIICVPILLLPGVLGIFEIIYAANLISTYPKPVHPSQILAIFEICAILFLNVISLAAGIIALVNYSNPRVQEYYSNLAQQHGNAK